MAGGNNGATLREVHRLWDEGTVAGLSETQLLDRFLARRDEVAFEALVSRHGPMVLGVCRRLLRDPHAIDDAFQATFLILVRKARALRAPHLLGPWLYGVAYRVALRSRTVAARRSSRESPYTESAAVPDDEPGNEIRPVIDEELGRLPERYRAALVLCYLEGHTHHEAAERLRCPVGTVRSRLARGREQLRHRLIRRGLAPAGLVAADVLVPRASAAVPPVLLHATVAAANRYAAGKLIAAGVVSVSAAALTQGVLTTMFVSKLKIVAVALLALGLSGGGAHFLTKHGALAAQAPDGPGAAEAPKEQPAPQDDLALLQGVWEITERTPKNPPGKEFLGETWKIQGAKLTFGRSAFVFQDDDGSRLEGGPLEVSETIQLDQQATPKRITISAPTPGNPRLPGLQGIYQLKGDHLRVQLAPRGAQFPADFSSEVRGLTIVLQRQSPLEGKNARVEPPDRLPAPEPPKQPPAPKDDLALLQGGWDITRAPTSASGKTMVGETWTFHGVALSMLRKNLSLPMVRHAVTLDQQSNPRRITIAAVDEGAGEPTRMDRQGVYELEGDELRILFVPESQPFPTDFSKNSANVIVFKRRLPAVDDVFQLQGTWAVAEADLNALPDLCDTWRFQGLKLMMSRTAAGKGEAAPVLTHEFKLDPKAAPKRITISRQADDRWTVIYGTYQLQGNHLRILTFKPGEPVPADFSKPSIVLVRQSPLKGEAIQPPAQTAKEEGAQASLKNADGTAPVEDDLLQIQGPWTITETVPKDLIATWDTWRFQGLKLMMSLERIGKGGVGSGSTHDFKLDPRANPKRVTISQHADGRTLVSNGIYQLKGDHLRILLSSKQGEPAPADFSDQLGNRSIVFKRQSPLKGEAFQPPAQAVKGESARAQEPPPVPESPKPKEPAGPKDDLQLLQGVWQITEIGSETLSEKWDNWKFQGMTLTMGQRNLEDKGITKHVRLDQKATPKRMTILHPGAKEYPQATVNAIYQLEGDQLRVLMAPAGQPFPTDFSDRSRAISIVFKWKSPLTGEEKQASLAPRAAEGVARAHLDRAKEHLQWSKAMLEKGYVSKTQVLFAELEVQLATLAAEEAQAKGKASVTPGVAPPAVPVAPVSAPPPSQPQEEPRPASIKELELRLKLGRMQLERYENLYKRQALPLAVVQEQRIKAAIVEAQLDAEKERLNNAKSLPEGPKPTGMSLKELEVRLKFARQELERYEQLYKNNAVPMSIVEEERLGVAIVEAQIDAAKERLVAAKPAPDNPQTSSVPSPDRPTFQGLENRLKRAQRVFAYMKRLSDQKTISPAEVDVKAGASLDAVIEEIETQDESLSDDLELLEAQKLRKEAELRVAEAQLLPTKLRLTEPAHSALESKQLAAEMQIEEAQRDVKKAELSEVEVRIKQSKRKRDQIERLKKEVEPAKP